MAGIQLDKASVGISTAVSAVLMATTVVLYAGEVEKDATALIAENAKVAAVQQTTINQQQQSIQDLLELTKVEREHREVLKLELEVLKIKLEQVEQ